MKVRLIKMEVMVTQHGKTFRKFDGKYERFKRKAAALVMQKLIGAGLTHPSMEMEVDPEDLHAQHLERTDQGKLMPDNYWNTTVPVARSEGAIEKLVQQFGASRFGVWKDYDNGIITAQFYFKNLPVEFKIDINKVVKARLLEKPSAREEALRDKAPRVAMRILYYHIKTALVAVENGIVSFEDVFLSHIMTNTGKTLGEMLVPRLQDIVTDPGRMLPGGK